jgi:hypothetical protein
MTCASSCPTAKAGRAMTDLQRMGGHADPPETAGDEAISLWAPRHGGRAGPVPAGADGLYPRLGHLFCSFRGYEPCCNSAEVIAAAGTTGAGHGKQPRFRFLRPRALFVVGWDQVKEHMHLERLSAREQGCPAPVGPTRRAAPPHRRRCAG